MKGAGTSVAKDK